MFDPTLPIEHTDLDAAQMRSQFNGLKDISDAIASTNITNVVVDSVTTLDAGQPATVTVSVSGNTLHLAFGIPQGANGATGAQGTQGDTGAQGGTGGDGPQGPQGPQGAPGEVTNADLASAIAAVTSGSSANSNGVGTLGMTVSAPPLQSEVQALSAKIDELILALRR